MRAARAIERGAVVELMIDRSFCARISNVGDLDAGKPTHTRFDQAAQCRGMNRELAPFSGSFLKRLVRSCYFFVHASQLRQHSIRQTQRSSHASGTDKLTAEDDSTGSNHPDGEGHNDRDGAYGSPKRVASSPVQLRALIRKPNRDVHRDHDHGQSDQRPDDALPDAFRDPNPIGDVIHLYRMVARGA